MEKNDNRDLDILSELLMERPPILFTGAGFSFGANKKYNPNIQVPKNLSNMIMQDFLEINEADEDYAEIERYNLKEMCGLANDKKSIEKLNRYLIEIYSDLEPTDFQKKIICYPWRKIYTTNIDDLIETIYGRNKVEICVQNSKREKINYNTKALQYYKIHGCINNRKEGFTFTENEYVDITASHDYRLMELCSDMQKESIIFLGTNFDEADIEYYLKIYENYGYESRRGKIIFINPKPSYKLRRRVEELNGIIIKWTAEEFFNYVSTIRYNKGKIKSIIGQMNYENYYRLTDIKDSYKDTNFYYSNLYKGEECCWRDILYDWDFIHPEVDNILEDIKNEKNILANSNVHCFCIAGISYIGKSTILKRIGIELLKEGYEVIEFKGEKFNDQLIKEYISVSNKEKFVLLIDNSSYIYPVIEKLLLDKNIKKTLYIISAARTYYHEKKKYYLQGSNKSFYEYSFGSKIEKRYAANILNRLKDKGYEGYLREQKNDEIKKKLIKREKELIIFMLKLSNGIEFKNIIDRDVSNLMKLDDISSEIMVILSIFDALDIGYLPLDLLPIMYNMGVNRIRYRNDNLYNTIKISEQGLQVRNPIYKEAILKNTNNKRKIECIKKVLINISARVNEKSWNYFRNIFECLIKQDKLRVDLQLSINEIKNLYYDIKRWYEDTSYYWLQLGLLEQYDSEFERALNHLQQAQSISPNTYQVQHALGRNYLKHANYLNDIITAEPIFKVGEEKLLKLIEEKEIEQPLAYSINTYLKEKIKFISKFDIKIDLREYKKMYEYLIIMINKRAEIANSRDILVIKEFMTLLRKNNIYGVIYFDSENTQLLQNIISQNKINIV